MRRLALIVLLLGPAVAHAQPTEPTQPEAAPPPAPDTPPVPSGPCGPTIDATTSYVCSTQRLDSPRALTLYRDFVSLSPRGGFALGVRGLSTLTTDHRRESVELGLGWIWDRIKHVRVSGGPVRAVSDGNVDKGVELAIGLVMMQPRFHIILQGVGVFGIQFGNDKFALGLALGGGYELLSTDRFALTIGGRVGFETYKRMTPETAEEDHGALYASVSLGVDFYQRLR